MIGALKRIAGSTALRLLRAFYRTGDPVDLAGLDAKRVLVVQGLRIGDTVATLPAITALKRRWPDAEVVSLASSAASEILAMSGLVDTLLHWPTDGSRLRAGKHALADLSDVDVAVVFDCTLTSMLAADSVEAVARVGYDSCHRGFGLTHPVEPPPYWNRPVARYASDATSR